jgi:hypothetical protein
MPVDTLRTMMPSPSVGSIAKMAVTVFLSFGALWFRGETM